MPPMELAAHVEDSKGWYVSSNACSSAEELLSETFQHSKLMLQTLLRPKDFELLFPTERNVRGSSVSEHTIYDIQRCIRDARFSYESRIGHSTEPMSNSICDNRASSFSSQIVLHNKRKSSPRSWLTALSTRLVHYGNIFDVIAQHHPEYVSLAWGTFKLLFTTIVNHAEVATKLGESINQIADLLPQQSLLLVLYPTPQMQVSVARLYAHVLHFFLSALKWYEDSRIIHAIKSIWQPWDVKFQHQFDSIAAEAQQIRLLTDLASKAELRDTRLEVVHGNKQYELLKQEIEELKKQNQRLEDLVTKRMGGFETSMLTMCKEIHLDLKSQRTTLNRVHLTQMLSLPFWSNFPSSGESLQFCRSMRNRRRDRTQLNLPNIQTLESWASEEKNSVLLIDTCISLAAKTFMIDLIDLFRNGDFTVIWALRYADYWETTINASDIIRMLVLQTMQVCADNLLNTSFPVKIESLREAASLDDWVAILNQVLAPVGHAFIVLDADLLSHATFHDRSEAVEILDLLRLKLSSHIKIVTAKSTVPRSYADELTQSKTGFMIQTGMIGNLRAPRRHRRRNPIRVQNPNMRYR